MLFEIEGEHERVTRAGETFWEPGGDTIHHQDGNNRADSRSRYTVTAICPPDQPMLVLVDDEELAGRIDKRAPRPFEGRLGVSQPSTRIDTGRSRPFVIFDGDCGFCTRSATWIARRLHRADGVDAQLLPKQRADLAGFGTTDERASREVLWVGTDGVVRGGAEAIAQWLRFRGGLYGWVGRCLQAPVVSALAAALYRLVAANR